MENNYILACIFLPVLGAFLLPIIGKVSELARNLTSLILVAASLVFSLLLAPAVLAGHVITISHTLPLGFNLVFTADCLAVFMAIASSLVGTIIVLYSFGYISHYGNRNEYYLMVTLFLGAMMGLIYSGNLIFLYLFWEITAIASWRLIGFFREKEYVYNDQ